MTCLKIKIFFVFCLSLITSSILGQSLLENADQEFSRGYWSESISIYKQLIEKPKDDNEFIYLSKQLGIANYKLKNYKEANLYFEKIKQTVANWDKKTQVVYFNCLRNLEQYEEAKQVNKNYLSENYNVVNFVEFPIDYKTSAKDSFFTTKPVNIDFGPSFLGMFLNKNNLTLSLPTVTKKEQTVFYDLNRVVIENDTTVNTKESEKIIKSKKSIFYRGTPCTFGENKILFSGNISEHSTYKEKKKEKYNISDEAVNLLNLFEYKIGEKNEFISLLNQENSNTTTPYFDSLHQVVFFSSDRIGGKGDYDIYYAFYENNTWTTPKNLEQLNTPYDDVYPFLESGILTFSSKGGQNFGGLDNYSAVCKIDTVEKIVSVSNIVNLGKPINSSFDDFGMIWKNRYSGYFATNKISKNKQDNLLFFDYNPIDTLQFEILDEDNNKIEALAYVYTKNKNNGWDLIDSLTTTSDSKMIYPVDLKKEYQFDIQKKGYEIESITFDDGNNYNDLKQNKEKFKDIILKKKPTVFTLKDDEGNPIAYAEVTIYGERKNIGNFKTDKRGYWSFNDSTLFNVEDKYVVNYIDDKGNQQSILLEGIDILGERKALKDKNNKSVKNKNITVLSERELLAKRTTDENGQFEYEFDEDINYDITIEAKNYEIKEIDFSYDSDTDLERGDFNYDIKLKKKTKDAPLFTIKDEFGNEFENAEVKVYKEAELLTTLFTDDSGSFDYDFENEADYSVEINVQGYETEKIDFTYDTDFEQNYDIKLKKKTKDAPLFTIKDEFGNEFENAEVKVYKEAELLTTLFTDDSGSFDYDFENEVDYSVEINVQGYETEKIDFTYDTDFESGYKLRLKKKKGTLANTNEFDVVYFGFNNYRLRRKTRATLRNVARYLDNNPSQNFIFYGHTDAVGPNDYNKRLAKKRVEYCLEYLLTLGDYSNRITTVSIGEDQVLNGCTTWYGCSKDENQVNRRVEILMRK